MYKARFVSESGTFYFDLDHGVVFDISPIDEIDVDIASSQGFGQIGSTVVSRSVAGLSRTIKGKVIGNARQIKKELLRVFTPFSTGRLYFNDRYACECVVQKTPAIGAKDSWVAFALMLYCPSPFWQLASPQSYLLGGYTPAFSFPVRYDSHVFGIRQENAFVNCLNPGTVRSSFEVIFGTAAGDVTDYGIINIYTGEELKIRDTLSAGQTVRVYREDGRLRVEKTVDGEKTNIFAALDEDSTLFWMNAGDNVIRMTAGEGADQLTASISFYAEYAGVYDGM